jgi:hypothetical protein
VVPASAWGDITWEEFLERQGGIISTRKHQRVGGKIGMLNGLFYSGPSSEALHEQYAKKRRIDEEAPVKAFHEVRHRGSRRAGLGALSDVPGWGPGIQMSMMFTSILG